MITGNRLAANAKWMISGNILQSLFAFLINLILVRIFAPEDFGRFAILQANLGLINMFLSLRLADLVIKLPESAGERPDLSRIAGLLVAQNVILITIVGTLGLVVIGASVELAILTLGTVLGSWAGFQVKVYEIRFNYKRVSVIETGSHVVSHALTLLGALVGMGPVVLYLRELVRAVSLMLGLVFHAESRLLRPAMPSRSDLAMALKGVRGMWFDGILEQSFDRLAVLAVAFFGGEHGAGLYAQARRLAVLPHSILEPISFRILYNYFSRLDAPDRQYKFSRLLRGIGLILPILSVVAIAAYYLAETFIPLLFGEAWYPAVPIFQCLAGFIVFSTVFNMLKGFYMTESSMTVFILFGRGILYVSLVAAVLYSLLVGTAAVLAISTSLSVGYALASLVLVSFSWLAVKNRGR